MKSTTAFPLKGSCTRQIQGCVSGEPQRRGSGALWPGVLHLVHQLFLTSTGQRREPCEGLLTFGFRVPVFWWNWRAVIFCVRGEGWVSAQHKATWGFFGRTSSRSVCHRSLESWEGGLDDPSLDNTIIHQAECAAPHQGLLSPTCLMGPSKTTELL